MQQVPGRITADITFVRVEPAAALLSIPIVYFPYQQDPAPMGLDMMSILIWPKITRGNYR